MIQAYGGIGAAMVREQIEEARRRGAASLSIYVVETATDAELAAVAAARDDRPVDAAVLRDIAHAYLRGAIAILDHGTPAELREWGALFARERS